MIVVKLRDALENYRLRTGSRLTYELLAEKTGISRATLQSLGARPSYNTRLSTIEKICIALKCSPGDLLQLSTDIPNDKEPAVGSTPEEPGASH